MEGYKRNLEIYYDPKKERTTIVAWNLSSEQRNQLALILMGSGAAIKPAPSMDTPSPIETMTPPTPEEMGNPLAVNNDQAKINEVGQISTEDPVTAAKKLLELMAGGGTEVMAAAVNKNKEIAAAVLAGIQAGSIQKASVQNYLYTIRSLNPSMEAAYGRMIAQMGIDNTLPFDKAVIEALKVVSDNQLASMLQSIAA